MLGRAACDQRLDPAPAKLARVPVVVVGAISDQDSRPLPGRPTRPRTRGIASTKGSNWLTSLRLTPVADQASGRPAPSVRTWCLTPARPRSTGLGPSPEPPLSPARTWHRSAPATNRSDRSPATAPTTADAAAPRRPPPATHASRRKAVIPLPYPNSCGRCSQPIPVCNTNKKKPSRLRTAAMRVGPRLTPLVKLPICRGRATHSRRCATVSIGDADTLVNTTKPRRVGGSESSHVLSMRSEWANLLILTRGPRASSKPSADTVTLEAMMVQRAMLVASVLKRGLAPQYMSGDRPIDLNRHGTRYGGSTKQGEGRMDRDLGGWISRKVGGKSPDLHVRTHCRCLLLNQFRLKRGPHIAWLNPWH